MSKIEEGNSVTLHYVGTLEDGTQFDSSRDREEPISFVVGGGQMIAGFDQNVRGMELGETKTFTVKPEDAYGLSDPDAIQEVSKEQFPEGFSPENGILVRGVNENNEEIVAVVLKHTEETVTLDFNHPLAGRNLVFEVEIVEIEV